MNYPTLYKQTTTGKIQSWQISVKDNVVTTVYGQLGGKLQATTDVIREGKNLGKSNGTTPETQAIAQARQCYDEKIKEGYVENIKIAEAMENTLDGVEPMLAFDINKKLKHVQFPGFCQPKLDGLRMLCIITNGKAKLWSRTQKPYNTLPHIISEVEAIYGDETYLVLDGEAYTNEFATDFNSLTSCIKRDEVSPNAKKIQYHIYDVVAPGNYNTRTVPLAKIKKAIYLKQVETVAVNSMDEILAYQTKCIENQYEGCMYRNPEGLYEHKRSANLLKVKTFLDEEFIIVDVEEGCGKLMGHVGAFVCKMSSGKTFKATPAMTLEEKEAMWKKRKDYIGKFATVKYQNKTPEGSLRFPILKCIRDYE